MNSQILDQIKCLKQIYNSLINENNKQCDLNLHTPR